MRVDDIDYHSSNLPAPDVKTVDARIAELEAALRDAELLLTGLAMLPASSRTLVATDAKLSSVLLRARAALEKP